MPASPLSPGLTVAAADVIEPTIPVPPRVVPAPAATGLPPCEPSTRSVPALIAVVPVYVLLAVRSSVPGPLLLSPTEPEITPPSTSSAPELSTLTVPVAARVIGRLTVLDPDVCEASIEVNEALSPLIEYPVSPIVSEP